MDIASSIQPDDSMNVNGMAPAAVFKTARRIVVKVGSSLVTNDGRGLDEEAIGQWSQQLAALVQQGREWPRA
jgi:glutamate 5-kinase